MTLRRRFRDLCRVLLADTLADLAGLLDEVRAESAPRRLDPVRLTNRFTGRGPVFGRRVRNVDKSPVGDRLRRG